MTKILVLASNPRKDLNLDDEIRILQDAIDRSRNRDQFRVEKAVGVQVGDLQHLVLRHKPQIIHFCGHGSGQEGLIFKVDGGGERQVRAEALAGLFELCPFVKCVLLNACYSEAQADAIAQHTDYVIGMNHTIQDNAAIAFSKGFYTALGDDESIERSFRFGVNAIQLEVSGSSIKRSGTTSVEERKAEVIGIVEKTELKEHEKPRIFIKGREQTATDLAQLLSNEFIGAMGGAELLVKIDAFLENTVEEPTLQTFSFQAATVKVVVKTVRKPIEKQGFFGKRTEYIDATETVCNVIYQDGKAEFFEEKLDDYTVLEMVKIKGGNFTMGSPSSEKDRSDDEGPQHLVRIQPFFMGRYAVTQEQWFTVAQDFPKVKIDLNPDPSYCKGARRPVEQVSWWEAVEFCDRLSQKTGKTYRLPSESEWEYACRAGTTTPFYCGETITTDLANYDGNYTYGSGTKGVYRQQTIDVGSFPPNGFGLYDMHGNVWEWCVDHWHENYQGAPIDGSAWIEGGDSDRRLLRGGSWNYLPRLCRSACRGWDGPDRRYDHVGFRVVYFAAWTPA